MRTNSAVISIISYDTYVIQRTAKGDEKWALARSLISNDYEKK